MTQILTDQAGKCTAHTQPHVETAEKVGTWGYYDKRSRLANPQGATAGMHPPDELFQSGFTGAGG